jgi:hypothetical protein
MLKQRVAQNNGNVRNARVTVVPALLHSIFLYIHIILGMSQAQNSGVQKIYTGYDQS